MPRHGGVITLGRSTVCLYCVTPVSDHLREYLATRTTLNISLPAQLGQLIEERVASGRYSSASEVIRAALRLLEECEGRRVPTAVARRHNVARSKPIRPQVLNPDQRFAWRTPSGRATTKGVNRHCRAR
jgi:antitoxin ParD1/3/4